MTTDEIRTFVQRHVEHISTHDAVLTAGDHAEDGILESPSTGTHQGRTEITQNYERWNRAFPDFEVMLDNIVAEDDQAAVFFRLAGTHHGDFLGLPATGKRIEFRGVMLLRFESNLIAYERRLYDFSGLLIKLGILKVKPG
jgi:steroid delta-isomerase-like uncharacterized protein